MGSRRPCRPSHRRVRDCLAMDPQRLRPLSRIPGDGGRARRIQWQVHGQPTGAARLVACNSGRTQPYYLSKLLLSASSLAIHGTAPRRLRHLISIEFNRAGKRVLESLMNVHAAASAKAQRFDEQTSTFAGDVLDDLSQRPKRLSPKYFYDAAGSELFEQITLLPEYYPTRTELGILRDRGSAISAALPKGAALVEFGAGATTKVRLLLNECAFGAYVPVDISGDFLSAQADALRKDFPGLDVYPVAADFTAPFALPDAVAGMPKVGFFPGSTLGNFEPHEACAFLRSARDILGKDAQMVIGVDLEKDERVLYEAYNDSAGVTARFNLNVLHRINRELGGNFDTGAFTHRAIYNRERHRIEMHLISRRTQTVRVLGRSFSFRAGESIHTESSYKYSLERFAALARGSGWTPRESWTDAAGMFSVHALVASD